MYMYVCICICIRNPGLGGFSCVCMVGGDSKDGGLSDHTYTDAGRVANNARLDHK